MLRGLLGFARNDGTPPPPRGKIEVVCPTCGAVQYEPLLVVSTFCRKCGDHLRIEKKRVIGSGIRKYGDDEPSQNQAAAALNEPRASLGVSSDKTSEQIQAEPSHVAAPRPTKPLSGANALRAIIARSQPELALTDAKPVETPEVTPPLHQFDPSQAAESVRDHENVEAAPEAISRTLGRIANQPAPTVAPPTANATTLQKMKDQGLYRQQHFKVVQCFECTNTFKVGRSSRSANCSQCGSLISLEDIEVNTNWTQPIKTRGDLIIRKPGHVSTAQVYCKDLRCFGMFQANVDCSGDAIFKSSGNMIGELRCHRLIIEKGTSVTFANLIYADEVEIHAKISGTIFSRGAVLITAYGSVDGDVTARSVSIEPGGELNGAMNIIRADSLLSNAPEKLH